MSIADIVLGLERRFLGKLTGMQYMDLSQIDELCEILASQVEDSDFAPDYVVGILNKGFYPALKVSEHLGLPLEFISISYPKLAVAGFNLTDSSTLSKAISFFYRGTPSLRSDFLAPSLEGKNVLVVDDDTGLGLTLSVATTTINQFNPRAIRTSTLFVAPDGYRPDFHAIELILSANPLLISKTKFPWMAHSPFFDEHNSIKTRYFAEHNHTPAE